MGVYGGARARPVVAAPPVRVVEVEGDGAFASIMEQSEQVRRGARGEQRQKCQVMIAVSHDGETWFDAVEYWSGYWTPGGPPLPTESDIRRVAQQNRARFGRSQIRSVI